MTILNHTFRVCGIVEHGKGGRKFLPIKTLGALLVRRTMPPCSSSRATIPQTSLLIEQEIHNVPGLSQYQVQTMQDFLSQLTPEHLPGFNIGLRVVMGIAVIVGFIVIFQAMYTAVLERTREIGILKSLGASQFYIVNVVLRETAFLAILGIILGDRPYLCDQGRHARALPYADLSRNPAVDFERDPYRVLRRTARSELPRDQGRQERSHRCAGVRINTGHL